MQTSITNGENPVLRIDDLDPFSGNTVPSWISLSTDRTGGDISSDRFIRSAPLELFLNEVNFANAIPTLLDLVSYPMSGLRPWDFNSPPILFRRVDFFQSDQGKYVAIDVTPLMREAQRLGLSDFQVRFLLDLAVSDVGFVGIEDLPHITITAPLLTVEYE